MALLASFTSCLYFNQWQVLHSGRLFAVNFPFGTIYSVITYQKKKTFLL